MNPNEKMILMIGSSSNNPKLIGQRTNISDNNKGEPLTGVKYDIKGIQKKFHKQHAHIIQTSQNKNMLLPKKYIVNWLQQKFDQASYQVYIFYSGHGHHNGDWAIETLENPEGDFIKLEQIVQIWKNHRPNKKANLVILMDSCHSGCWCYRLSDIDQKGLNISIYACCERKEMAKDYLGGLLFKCIYGTKKQFEDNYEVLSHYQNPVYLKSGADRVAVLPKIYIQQLMQNIQNALIQGTSPRSIVQTKKYQNGFYEGEVINGQRNGKGIMKYKNRDKYDGQWKDDKRNGKGIYSYANGQIYDGQHKDGIKVGKGIYYYSSGNKYQGQFNNNKRNGKGIYYYFDGDKFEGQFKDDQRNGVGIFYSVDGDKQQFIYKDGRKISIKKL